ncbi:MAG: hypothetical protein HQK53_10145 [Oligoflexia bacterium]|nr:hypothetical protein [Oligoflexia bacterium]
MQIVRVKKLIEAKIFTIFALCMVAIVCVHFMGAAVAADEEQDVLETSPLLSSADVSDNSIFSPSARRIAEIFKASIREWRPIEFKELLAQQYVRLHLMDKQQRWRSDALARISESLLPSNINAAMIDVFVDRVVSNVESNPYLVNFLMQAQQLPCKKIRRNISEEGRYVLPRMVAFALVVDTLTRAELDHPDVLEAVVTLFEQARNEENIGFTDLGLFVSIKLRLIESPIKEMIRFRREGKVDPDFAKYYLPLNVLEAMLADCYLGNTDNAASAWPLVMNGPSTAGPASFSTNMRAVQLRMPQAKNWNDLYGVWNLAFTSQFDTAPFLMLILLVPEVSGYQEHPEEYLTRRALALYTYLHYSILGTVELERRGLTSPDWSLDQELVCLWGKMNVESAKDYNLRLKHAHAD